MSKSLLWSWVAAGEEWATPWAPPGNAGAYVLGLHETLRGRLASLAQAERAAVEAALRRVYRQARATRAAMVTAPGGGLAADRFYSRVPYHPSQVTPQLFFWHLYMLHWRTVRGRGLARVTLGERRTLACTPSPIPCPDVPRCHTRACCRHLSVSRPRGGASPAGVGSRLASSRALPFLPLPPRSQRLWRGPARWTSSGGRRASRPCRTLRSRVVI